MEIKIESGVAEAFPSGGFYVFGIKGINNANQNEAFYQDIKKSADSCLSADKEDTYNSEIAHWKSVYMDMALPRKSGKSSFESLYKRYTKNQYLSKINPFVDLYNAMSLKHGVCMGAYDYQNLFDNLTLRFAQHAEEMLPIGSDEPIMMSSKGVVYADSKGVVCSYWNYRDSARTCVSENSKDILMVIDAGKDKQLSKDAVNDIKLLLKNHFDCQVTDHIYVSADNTQTTITI